MHASPPVVGSYPIGNLRGRDGPASSGYLDGIRPSVAQAPPPPPPATAAGGPQAAILGKPALRKGKWTVEEETYTACIIDNFNKGYLCISPGTTLRSYLSDQLNCDPMRITKKFAGAACIGKQVFHPCERTPDVLAAMQRAQTRLNELEQVFLAKLQQQQKPSRKSAAAAAANAAVAQDVGVPGALSGGPGLDQDSTAAYQHFNAHAQRTNPNMYVKTSDDDRLMHSRVVPTGTHSPRPVHPHELSKAVPGPRFGAGHADPFGVYTHNPPPHAALSHAPPPSPLLTVRMDQHAHLPHSHQPSDHCPRRQHTPPLEYTEDDRNAGGLLLDFFASVQLRASSNTLFAPRAALAVTRSQPADAMVWDRPAASAPAVRSSGTIPSLTDPEASVTAVKAPVKAPSSPTTSTCSMSSAEDEAERLQPPSKPGSAVEGDSGDMDTTAAVPQRSSFTPVVQRKDDATTPPCTSPHASPSSMRKRSLSEDVGSASAPPLPMQLQRDSNVFAQAGAPPAQAPGPVASSLAPPLKKPRSFGSLEALA